ncbi:Ig-like domain repeat protein [Streptomyces sp. NBC_01190]|uniref:Ig-like domain repeat protein n=1 Tax=Streptomyces sp. NBC_01190 TaxID=2903767 RepID=UPI0038697E91|nr:Ig-like domain repeat protein [Streptomyces sp. NBC_01190]
MRWSRTSVTTALAVLLGVSGGIGVAGTASAGTPAPLGLPGYSHMVVDGPHRHVFISGGPGSTGLAVTDFDGGRVGTVTGEPGATSMALSPDGGTLYVALPGSDAVSAVDTATLTETARYSTGTGPQEAARYLAFAGGRLWFGYGEGGRGGIGSIDVGAARPTVSPADGGFWYAAPVLASSPAAPGVLVAGDNTSEPSQVKVYDVSAGSAVTTAYRSDGGAFVQDLAITPDGKDVLVATGYPYYQQVFKLGDLSDDGRYTTSNYPDSVAVAPDGTVAAGVHSGRPDIYVFPAGTDTALHSYDVSSENNNVDLASAGLAWAPDGSRLFAITEQLGGGPPILHVLADPRKAGTQLSLPIPQFGYTGQPVTLSGQLTSELPFDDGQVLHLVRTDPAHPDGVPLADVPVAADGTFAFTDTPTVNGTNTYTVTYPGDTTHAGATETAQVVVDRAAAQLVLNGPAKATRATAVKLSGTLTSPLALPAGQVVNVSRADASGTTKLPAVRVAADGTFAFTDTPQIGGADNYAVTYAGDGSHGSSAANHVVQVSRSATAVSVTANAADYTYGATARITAHLGATYNGRTLSIYAQPYGGAKTLIKAGKVDAHGNLAVGYQVTRRTAFTAAFAGDYRYAPATTAAHYVWSYARVTEAQKSYYTSARIGAATYRVYHHKTNPVTGATIAPVKRGECVAFTAQVLSGGAWHTIATASCIRTGTTGAAWATLSGTHVIGYHYRFRAEYVRPAADPANLSTYGSWQYFLFRT